MPFAHHPPITPVTPPGFLATGGVPNDPAGSIDTPDTPRGRPRALKDVERLGESIAELAARIQAATYQLLVLIREFDERAGWNGGFRSCAHWLNWRTGLDLGAAREKVRVARALAELPRLSAAMQRGDLSYSKVRALTRVATPANESELLDFARCATAAQVERLVRAWRRVDRVAEAADDRRRHESRHLETWVDDDGMVVIRGRLSPEVGAVVRCALEAAADRLHQEAKAAAEDTGVETSAGQRRADALGLVAEAALAADLDRGASTSGDRYQVVVHVDEGVLGARPSIPVGRARGSCELQTRSAASRCRCASATTCDAVCGRNPHAPFGLRRRGAICRVAPPRRCAGASPRRRVSQLAPRRSQRGLREYSDGLLGEDEQDGADSTDRAPGQSALEGMEGLHVSAETSRRLACDAATVVMRHGRAGRVLDVGRKRRTISPALRRALTTRDPECRFPGCPARRCDAHHVRHWAAGGATRLDNLVRLCRRHHRAVHEEGFRVRLHPDGTARFCRPDGRPLPAAPPAPHWDGPPLAPTLARLGASGITIGAETGRPHWHGERLDEVWAIDVLWRPRPTVDPVADGGQSPGPPERIRGKLDGSAYQCGPSFR